MNEAERPAPPLSLALLGPFDVRLAGQPLPPLRSQKSQWLLALLALQRGRAVERGWLAGTLWPESSEQQAAFNLTRNLTDLRHVLGPEARRLGAPASRTLRLDLTGSEADVLIFDEAIASGDPPSLRRAVALRRGPLLLGCHEDWVLPERLSREESYLAALERLAADARARGDPAAAASYLRRAVAVDPLRESAQRALLEALAASGELAAATQVYREFRLLLHRELNAAPDPETVASYERIRADVRRRLIVPHDALLPAPAAGSAGDAGSRRREARAGRRPLPQPLTRLVGREPECREVRACLATERLVTLTGPGGVGKTRLAIRVAAECRDEFRDGLGFVDLASVNNPALIPQAVAAALALREQPGRTVTETVEEFLGDQQVLLVLDNCEHLLDAAARLAEASLGSCPELRILATSRQSLGLTGEVTWRVPPLSVPGVQGWPDAIPEPLNTPTPEHLMQYDAVRLFVERGMAADRTFRLSERTAAEVVAVCRQLEGIPLAIELAAARLRALSVEEIAARLDDRFGLLTGGSRTALPRQRALRATMDWSYELLSQPERLLLQRLALFAGQFSLEGAEAVCSDFGVGVPGFGLPAEAAVSDQQSGVGGDPTKLTAESRTLNAASAGNPKPESQIKNTEVLDLLTRLVDRSLVIVEGPADEPLGDRRTQYRLLETVRQYAEERLRQSGEEATVRRRHVAFYLRLADQAAAGGESPDRVERLARLDAVLDNLRAALNSALQSAPEVALRFAAALAGYWEDRGHLAEGRQWLSAALERVGPGRRSLAGAAALEGASALALLQEDRRAAQLLLDESLAIRRDLGDRAGVAASLAHLAYVFFQRDDYPAARRLYEESLALQRELGNQSGLAAVLSGLGHVARRSGEYQEARSLQAESLATRRALGDRHGIAQSLIGLGDAVLELGETAAARAYYEEALAIRRELGDRGGAAGVLGVLADVAQSRGAYAEGRRLREEGLAVWRAMGCQVAVIHWLGALGHLAREQGQYEDAHRFYEESLLLRKQLGDPYTLSQSLEDFAELAAAERQWARMARLLGAAQALRVTIDKPLRPREQEDYDQMLVRARGALGEAAVAAAWAAGTALSLQQAIASALSGE